MFFNKWKEEKENNKSKRWVQNKQDELKALTNIVSINLFNCKNYPTPRVSISFFLN